VEMLSEAAVIFFSSIAVLTRNGNFWVMPTLHSVSGMAVNIRSKIFSFRNTIKTECIARMGYYLL